MSKQSLNRYDVIIAGAGPAGSTCARACAKQGLKTLLLDKEHFPRPKTCGGAVSMQALSHLDFALPENIIEQECFGVRVYWNDRAVEVLCDEKFAVLVSRIKFDALLADKAGEAGARFVDGEHVTDIRETSQAVEVVTETAAYRGLFLVGADGVHSRVAQTVRVPFQSDEITLAVVSHVSAEDHAIHERLGKTMELSYAKAPMGYGWLFAHRGYYSVGMAGMASRFTNPRTALAEFANALGLTAPDEQGHYIPLGGIKRTLAKGRIVLVGDAAGFADPFHGEGISHAVHSGKLAANAIIETIKTGRKPSYLVSRYQQEANHRITKNLRIALRMARLLENHPHLFLRIFFDHPEALRKYIDISRGRTDYKHFQRWILARLPFLLLPPKPRPAVT